MKYLKHSATDKVTGFTGVAIGFTRYITGPGQYLVQAPSVGGKRGESAWLDSPRLDFSGAPVIEMEEVEPEFMPKWSLCPCGHKACNLHHMTNLGRFHQGAGFEPVEVDMINEAFLALARESRP